MKTQEIAFGHVVKTIQQFTGLQLSRVTADPVTSLIFNTIGGYEKQAFCLNNWFMVIDWQVAVCQSVTLFEIATAKCDWLFVAYLGTPYRLSFDPFSLSICILTTHVVGWWLDSTELWLGRYFHKVLGYYTSIRLRFVQPPSPGAYTTWYASVSAASHIRDS